MTEPNPFPPFIPKEPHTLILGSFPCFNGKDYGDFFYSGSGRNFFWPLLSAVSNLPAGNAKEKKAICRHLKIALCDVILRADRKKGNCSDGNLHVLELNYAGVRKCLDAGVEKVLHTSRFVKFHFDKMFPEYVVLGKLLPSPSPASNRYIGGLEEYLELKRAKKIESVYEYRLMKYRELLG